MDAPPTELPRVEAPQKKEQLPPVYRGSQIESQLDTQRKLGWTSTALLSDYDNSYYRKGLERVTRKMAKTSKKYDIPNILISGREAHFLLSSVEQNNFPRPEIVVGAVGTEIWVLKKNERGEMTYVQDEDYNKLLASSGFDRRACVTNSKAKFIDEWSHENDGRVTFEFQDKQIEDNFLAGKDQKVQPYKVSYYMRATDESRVETEARMRKEFPEYEILISEDIGFNEKHPEEKKKFNIDLLAKLPKMNGKELGGGKHGAANYLCEVLGIDRGFMVGDSGNDVGMLLDSVISNVITAGGSKEELLKQIAKGFTSKDRFIGGTQFRRSRKLDERGERIPGSKDVKAYTEDDPFLLGPQSIVKAAIQRIEVGLKFETNESYRVTMKNLVKELRSIIEVPVLVPGYGPVIDKDTRNRADYIEEGKEPTPPGNEAPSVWMQDSIEAAAILSKKIPGTHFFVMGGPTGGKDYAPESALMKKGMVELGIPADLIGEDPTSSYTFANIVNFLNAASPGQEVDLIVSSHHASRVLFFLDLFGVPVRNIYKSQELIRYDAYENQLNGKEMRKTDAVIKRLEKQLEPSNTWDMQEYYRKQKGVEQTTYLEKFSNDNLWLRETLEYPQLFLRSLAGIQNDVQLKRVLTIFDYVFKDEGMSRFNLSFNDSPEVMRKKLEAVPWPPEGYEEVKDEQGISNKDRVIAKWRKENAIEKEWPQELLDKMNRLEEVKQRLNRDEAI